MDVYVLGAGFSRAVSAEMPLTRDLIRPLAKHLRGDPAYESYADQLEIVWDLEASLSYLAEDQPWLSIEQNMRKRTAYISAIEWLAGHLYAIQLHVLGSSAPDWLLTLVRRWHEEQAVIVSLNFDNLVEAAAQTLGGTGLVHYRQLMSASMTFMADRFGGYGRFGFDDLATFRLLKPHGSLNWAYSPDISGVQTEVFDTTFVGEFDRGGIVSPPWENARAAMQDLEPLIVPPVASKNSMFEHIWLRRQWLEAGSALRDAENVYVVGYSLPPSDLAMRMFLKENIAPKDYTVINIDGDVSNHFEHMLALHCAASWSGERAVANFVASLDDHDRTEHLRSHSRAGPGNLYG